MEATSLTCERLREVLDYRADTGVFVWKVANGRRGKPGQRAGFCAGNYLKITVDKATYLAHRLAWLYVHGSWPAAGYIDHRNGDGRDNRIANLRDASNGQNMQNQVRAHKNSRSQLLGAHSNRAGSYVAMIRKNGKVYHLGCYDSAEDAHHRYLAAKQELHEFGTLTLDGDAPLRRQRKPSATGFAGVEKNPTTGRYRAFFNPSRAKKVHVGYFDTPEEASAAREAARAAHFASLQDMAESMFSDV